MNKIMCGTKAVRDLQSRAKSLNESGLSYKAMAEGKGITYTWLGKWVNRVDPNTSSNKLDALEKILSKYEKS